MTFHTNLNYAVGFWPCHAQEDIAGLTLAAI